MSSNEKTNAYRAAKPDSPGAAPPAAEPAPKAAPGVRDVEQVMGPACTCVGMTVPWHEQGCPRKWTPRDAAGAFAKSAEPAKEPAPCGRCGGSGKVFDRPRVGPLDTKSACPECSPGGAT